MYAEMGILFPHLQEVDHLFHQPEEEFFGNLQSSNGRLLPHVGAMAKTMTISEYDLGGAEGDLFAAPELIIIEEPAMEELDYVAAAVSMMMGNADDGVIRTEEAYEVAGTDLAPEHLFADDHLCESKDILPRGRPAAEEAYSDLLNVRLPSLQSGGDDLLPPGECFAIEEPTQGSHGCLQEELLDQMSGSLARLTPADQLFDFQDLELGDVIEMRRVLQTQGTAANGRISRFSRSVASLPFEAPQTSGEERMQKLSRYRKKRIKRDFGRKIKYACRKAVADNQPRVRGRFAKTDECEPAGPRKQ